MSTSFPVLSDLPQIEQDQINRLAAIASASRTAAESAILTARAQYLTNEILEFDSSGNILRCSGVTKPTDALSGFAKGCIFIKTDASAGIKSIYENQGTSSSCLFDLMGQPDTATPVNAVASASTLTMSGAIVPGVHTVSTVTSDTTDVADGETLTIGSTVYRFKNTPAQAYDVKRTGTAATTLDNLKLAINASGVGDGTDYYAGTLAHPTVVATTNTNTTQVIQARVPGTAANSVATTTTASHLSWPGATMNSGTPGVAAETVTVGGVTYSFVTALSETAGAAAIANQVLFGANTAAALDNLKLAINYDSDGADMGTKYSTGTVIHPTVTATTNSDTEQTVEAKTKGTSGDAITTSETLSNGAWGPNTAHLSSGVDGTVAAAFDMLVDASYLYVAVAANTVADTNWRRVSLGSAF